jgi:hypothetical protein
MPAGHYLQKIYPMPYCPSCGGDLVLGWTMAGRRAWFCADPRCQWFDLAVAAVYRGQTDNLAHFRELLWRRRMRDSRDALP